MGGTVYEHSIAEGKKVREHLIFADNENCGQISNMVAENDKDLNEQTRGLFCLTSEGRVVYNRIRNSLRAIFDLNLPEYIFEGFDVYDRYIAISGVKGKGSKKTYIFVLLRFKRDQIVLTSKVEIPASRKHLDGSSYSELKIKKIDKRSAILFAGSPKESHFIVFGIDERRSLKPVPKEHKISVPPLKGKPQKITALRFSRNCGKCLFGTDLGVIGETSISIVGIPNNLHTNSDLVIEENETRKNIVEQPPLLKISRLMSEDILDCELNSTKENSHNNSFMETENNPQIKMLYLMKEEPKAFVELFLNETVNTAGSEHEITIMQTLKELLEDGNHISRKDTMSIVMQICLFLQNLHNYGIVHGNLNPSNITIVKESSKKILVKVNAYLEEEVITEDESLRYLAPEAIQKEKLSYLSDMWSLGCIIYEIVEGRPLFKSTTLAGIHEEWRHFIFEKVEFNHSSSKIKSALAALLLKHPGDRLNERVLVYYLKDDISLYEGKKIMKTEYENHMKLSTLKRINQLKSNVKLIQDESPINNLSLARYDYGVATEIT